MIGIGPTLFARGIVLPGDAPSAAPSAIYSTRQMRSAYAGKALKAQLSGGSTQDIGFVAGDLDTASLLSFANGADARVATWYDQSGNGYDVTQSNYTLMPPIVSSGTLKTQHGKPVLFFDSADFGSWLLSSASATGILSGAHWSCVAWAHANGGSSTLNDWQARCMWVDTNSNMWMSFVDNTGGAGNVDYVFGDAGNTNSVLVGVTFPVEGTFTGRFPVSSTQNRASINGGGGTENTQTGTTTTYGNEIIIGAGASFGGGTWFNGYIGELLFWNVALSTADLNAVASKVSARFDNGWSTVS